jgi:hypothetical protein
LANLRFGEAWRRLFLLARRRCSVAIVPVDQVGLAGKRIVSIRLARPEIGIVKPVEANGPRPVIGKIGHAQIVEDGLGLADAHWLTVAD